MANLVMESARVAAVAMGQVFVLGAIGFWLRRRGTFTRETIEALTRLVMNVTLPALAVVSLVRQLSFGTHHGWWRISLLFIGLLAVGLMIGWLVGAGLARPVRRTVAAMVGFPNAGYLPLPLVAALLPVEEARAAYVIIFLFILGFGPTMWSLGVWLLIGRPGQRLDWRECVTPPLIATVGALIVAALGWDRYIPAAVLLPLRWLGECSVPLIMLVLGGMLAEYTGRGTGAWAVVARLTVARLIVMPALVMAGLRLVETDRLLALVLVIEAAVPPATSLVIIARRYRSPQEPWVAQGIVVTYLASLVTLPCCLALSGYLGW